MPDASRLPTEPSALAAQSVRRDDPVRGILLVVLAVLFFTCSDATAKHLSQTLPSLEIAWLRYASFALLVVPVVVRGGPTVLRTQRPLLQILRGLGMLGSAIFFILGLRYLPMAEAAAISYVNPAFVTALSIPFLGERVGIRRWAAVVIGLIGVIIVIRPGSAAFDASAVFPILSAISWAVGIIVTRRMTGSEDATTTLVWTALTGLVVLSVLLPFNAVMPTPTELAFGLLIGVASTAAQWLLILAYRYGDASVLAPYSYIQLIWSTAAGYLVFSAVPDLWTFAGMAIIVASGVYTAHRERLRARGPA
ncbi:DMT family transporter [Azospirillum sp. TSO22-1]|uniref:DMT family transporter n=1 Tax=Azospirillum sp. TSO22-1 TaxID=716789 RepID=UPI000D61FEC5|nr:DMT family transporter [Azospirillum sp. TSO22-1]PWC55262.1 multidrug DMT transporter permease [Azospirillum sp. TSO22-1]